MTTLELPRHSLSGLIAVIRRFAQLIDVLQRLDCWTTVFSATADDKIVNWTGLPA